MGRRSVSAGLVLSWALPVVQLLQVPLLPYTPEHQHQCRNPNAEHYYENINKCCSLCPPGSRVLRSCNETVDTKCGPCNEGTFADVWSVGERCFSCSPPCKEGFVQVRECTRTQDRFCWCPLHHFCSLPISETCIRCRPYQRCRKGHGAAKPGTKFSDVQCEPCRPGTFSDVESHNATCKPHTICKSEITPGSSTSDAICNDLGPPTRIITALRPTTASGKRYLVTRSPTVKSEEVQQGNSTDIYSIAGLVAGVAFAVFILFGGMFCFFAFRKKGYFCAPPCGKEKQPFQSTKTAPENWLQEDTGALAQEKQNLLQISTSSSGSLHSPPASENSSGVSSMGTLEFDTEKAQPRSSPPNSCVHHSKANANQSGSGGTHVNVSCVVNFCSSSDHSLAFQPLNGSAPADSGEDLPLSKEESPLKKENQGHFVVEAEDSTAAFDHSEGKPLPLSVQDVGMKVT